MPCHSEHEYWQGADSWVHHIEEWQDSVHQDHWLLWGLRVPAAQCQSLQHRLVSVQARHPRRHQVEQSAKTQRTRWVCFHAKLQYYQIMIEFLNSWGCTYEFMKEKLVFTHFAFFFCFMTHDWHACNILPTHWSAVGSSHQAQNYAPTALTSS